MIFLPVLDSVNFVSEEKLTVMVEGDGSACAPTCVGFAVELTLSAGFLCLVERRMGAVSPLALDIYVV